MYNMPNTTPIPNIMFDEWLKILKYSELCILLVIARNTLGIDKNSITSLTRFENISGISRTAICKALSNLEKKEIILSKRICTKCGYTGIDVTKEIVKNKRISRYMCQNCKSIKPPLRSYILNTGA